MSNPIPIFCCRNQHKPFMHVANHDFWQVSSMEHTMTGSIQSNHLPNIYHVVTRASNKQYNQHALIPCGDVSSNSEAIPLNWAVYQYIGYVHMCARATRCTWKSNLWHHCIKVRKHAILSMGEITLNISGTVSHQKSSVTSTKLLTLKFNFIWPGWCKR